MLANFEFYPFGAFAFNVSQSLFSLQRSPLQRRGQRAELTMLSCTSILNIVLLGSSLFTTISPETDPTYELPKVVDATTEICEPKSNYFVFVIRALICSKTVHLLFNSKFSALSSANRLSIDSKYSNSLDLFVCPGMAMAARHVFVDVHLSLNLTDPATYTLYQVLYRFEWMSYFILGKQLFGR